MSEANRKPHSCVKPCFFVLLLSLGLVTSACGDSAPSISCDDLDCGDGNLCTTDTCDPESSTCENAPLSDGAICDIGGLPGECRAGICNGLSCDDLDCDDGNPCTADSCDSLRVVCASAPLADAAPCELDGEPAMCEAGTCTALTCDDLDCGDGNPCTVDSCDPESVACATSLVPDQTICAEVGAFGACSQGTCDLSQVVESGVIILTVQFTNPAQRPFYEAMCDGAVPLTGSFESIGDAWQTFIAMPVGSCTVSTFLLRSNGERACEGSFTLDVQPGYLGETSQNTVCQL